jgi:thiol-disulfide isomerase/thioredoxin
MKNIFKIIILFELMTIICYSSDKYNVYKDEKGRQVIVGKISWQQWQDSCGWKDFSAEGYEVTEEQKTELSTLVSERIGFLLFAGSWCGDSESEVPIIYKIIRTIGLDDSRIQLIGVNRQKLDIEGDASNYGIERVPTLVVLKDGIELGRIVEFPKISWAVDLIEILK